MSRKAKYTKEVKLKSSKDYLSGEVSATNIARSLGMGKNGGDIVRDWARQYEMNGDKIYMTKGRITTLDERIEIVKWCLDHDRSIKDTAGHFGCSYAQIRSWVIKYEDFGEDGLIDKRGKPKEEKDLSELELAQRKIQSLEKENEKLKRMNEILKKPRV